MANENTADGVLDQIEYQAKALVDTVRIEHSEIETKTRRAIGEEEEARREEAGAEEEARRDGPAAKGSVEGQVYFDVATEALGSSAIKMAKDAVDIVSDSDPGKFSIGGHSVATMEDDAKKMMRAPGVYNADGSMGGITKALFGDGMSLTERVNLAASSITSQGECNLKSWAMDNKDMPSTQMQRNMVFGKELASKAALDSVARARMMRSPVMGGPAGMGGNAGYNTAMVPDVSLASGPKFSMVDEAFEDEELFGVA